MSKCQGCGHSDADVECKSRDGKPYHVECLLDRVIDERDKAERERDEAIKRASLVPGLTAALDEARTDPASASVVAELDRLAKENDALRAESAALGRRFDAEIGTVLEQRNTARAEAAKWHDAAIKTGKALFVAGQERDAAIDRARELVDETDALVAALANALTREHRRKTSTYHGDENSDDCDVCDVLARAREWAK